MDTPWHREIVELHRFFERWLSGEPEHAGTDMDRFIAVHDPGFVIVTPDGRLLERDALLTGLRTAYGSRPGLRIEIKNVRLRHHIDSLLLVTYEEWQFTGDATTARLSTVAFREQMPTPNGLSWLHVHETWLTAPN